jgi:hypothetical protein
LAGVVFLTLLAAPDGETVDEAVRAVYERGEYQSDLPGLKANRQGRDGPDIDLDLQGELDLPPVTGEQRRTVGSAVLWILAFVFSAIALFWLFHVWTERRRAALAAPSGAVVKTPDAGRAPAPIPDAERLAGEGRYAEAIHAILLAVLARFASRLRPAWTAREASRAIGRKELRGLVQLVEVTLFGGRTATREDYERALALQRACVAGGKA